ncbi:MAG TPA: hypothetical protein VFQ91_10870 [Bryobacteraceae bacterium]|nr:hypothetical protein [Bryobacteraceae bacterium]
MRVDGPIVCYFAPGGGLGHLNRALALCLPLRDAGIDARIVTNSPFAAGLAALARCPVIQLAAAEWSAAVHAYCREEHPAAIITDTFPYGLRNEWLHTPPTVPLLHIARRLLTPIPIRRTDFAAILQAEPLSEEHEAALAPSFRLSGPLVLPPGRIATSVPPPLRAKGLTLVVHSGPPEELAALEALAEPPYVVLSPWSHIDYYPAANLYADARRIITGAGYNSMAGLLPHSARHTALAFPRRYDDQHARLRHFFREPADGTAQAIEAILPLL